MVDFVKPVRRCALLGLLQLFQSSAIIAQLQQPAVPPAQNSGVKTSTPAPAKGQPINSVPELQSANGRDHGKWLQLGAAKLASVAEKKLVPVRVIFVKGSSEKAGLKFVEFSQTEFDKIGMFRLAEADWVNWSLLVNKLTPAKMLKDTSSRKGLAKSVFGVSGADLMAWVPQSERTWEIQIDDGREIKSLAALPKPSTGSIGDTYDWILGSLGYNGIVIDKRGNLFLVASRADIMSGQAQAIVFGDSASRISVDRKQKAGTSLLNLVASSGSFGVFELTFQKPGTPQPKIGDKLSVSR
jgi:hypothetical protein